MKRRKQKLLNIYYAYARGRGKEQRRRMNDKRKINGKGNAYICTDKTAKQGKGKYALSIHSCIYFKW